MKHLYLILLSLLACTPAVVYAENEPSYLPSIEIRDGSVVQKDRTVQLSMDVDLSKVKIRTQHTVALTPVLVAADGSREAAFPPVVIDGKTRSKVYLRAQRLESVALPPYHDDKAHVILRHSRKPQTYGYQASVPYERWMLNGRVEIREEVHGCVNCRQGKSEQELLQPVLPAYIPDYRMAAVAPEPEPVKVRAEVRTARLQFRQDSHKILPDFRNNRAELDTVSSSINLVKQNTDVSIIGIHITGYASPEGSVPYNLKLSERRAKALADYISRNNRIDAGLLHVAWKGEDWEGLRQVLDRYPNLLKRDEVLRIIDECSGNRDLCEKQLRDLVPASIYQRLLSEVYPHLRRNEYKIEYNVRNFDLAEARRMIAERPDLLSLQEMYKVAGSYGKGTPEYDEVMAVAVRHFPQSPAALNDLARAYIDAREYAKAVSLLEGASLTASTPLLLNTLGVAYSGAGEYHKAKDAFDRAAKAGSAEAEHNLPQVQSLINQL